jgi:hypothetical protein
MSAADAVQLYVILVMLQLQTVAFCLHFLTVTLQLFGSSL